MSRSGRLGWAAALALALVFVAVAWLFSSTPPQPSRPVAIATGGWAPFVGPELEGDGPVARIVRESFRRLGFDPMVKVSSWPLVLEQLDRGEVLASFPFVASESRRDRFLLSEPILEFDYVLFYHLDRFPDGPDITGPDDLAELRVGRAEGYEFWPELDDAVDAFVNYRTSEEAFRALAAGEIDVLPEGLLPGREIIETDAVAASADRFGVVERAGNPLLGTTESLHVLLPRTDQAAELLGPLNAALADVKESELYDEVLRSLSTPTGADLVQLQPDPATGVVRAYAEPTGPTSVVVPAGTQGVVVGWPDAFTTPSTTDTPLPRVTVKLVNGPARGRVVHVPAASIRLVTGDRP